MMHNSDVPIYVQNKLRNMSIVCAFLVVVIHVRPEFQFGSTGWWLKQFFELGICEVSVPFFFVCSGYLLGKKFSGLSVWAFVVGGGYKLEVVKRIRTLVVPYFLWVIMFWFFRLVLVNVLMLLSNKDTVFFFLDREQWGLDLIAHPVSGQLWYLRMLFVLVLLSPMLCFLLRKLSYWFLGVLFVAYGLTCPSVGMPDWGCVQELTRTGLCSVRGYFYISVGLLIADTRKIFWRDISGKWLLVTGVALFIYRSWAFYCGLLYFAAYIGMIALPITLYGLWKFIPASPWPRWLVGNAFAIYCVHIIFRDYLKTFVNTGAAVWMYPLCAVCLFSVSLVASLLIRKHMPTFAKYLFGGR